MLLLWSAIYIEDDDDKDEGVMDNFLLKVYHKEGVVCTTIHSVYFTGTKRKD